MKPVVKAALQQQILRQMEQKDFNLYQFIQPYLS
jgi:hypothetical protein